MSDALADLKQRLAEIYDLERALGVLGWDQRTMMPPKGAAARSEASATLSGLVHERFVSDEIGRLLERGGAARGGARPRLRRREPDPRHAARLGEGAPRPAELAAAWAREGGKAHVAWLEAREANDFSVFLPAFRRVHEVALRWAELHGAGRLALRRLPRRVRARDEDGRGEGGLRRASAGADRDRPRRGRAGGRLLPRGRLPGRGPAGVPRRDPPRLRLRGGGVSARPHRPPVRDVVRP